MSRPSATNCPGVPLVIAEPCLMSSLDRAEDAPPFYRYLYKETDTTNYDPWPSVWRNKVSDA